MVIRDVVENDLCIGCGVCVDACPSDALSMKWSENGFLVAHQNQNSCNSDGKCMDVCPFNPRPEAFQNNETQLASEFLKNSTNFHPKLGRFFTTHAGYAHQFRATSSSGGIATYVFDYLLRNGVVKHVISVRKSDDNDHIYSYSITSNASELYRASKTRYYPVTLSDALKQVRNVEGSVAITGVACFTKALRLAQKSDPLLKDKIKFIVGIICGGVKSRFFTEYLGSHAGTPPTQIESPEYRIKDAHSTAGDYSFGCTNKASGASNQIKMKSVGDMWGTGLFKANACDFCDDVTTELADISLGDAWIEPFSKDGLGTSIIITRSELAKIIIEEGAKKGDIQLFDINVDRVIESQQGSFNHRHDGLAFRVEEARSRNQVTPRKRHASTKLPLYLKIVQHARLRSRSQSLHAWKKTLAADAFDKKMWPVLLYLRIATKISHKIKSTFKK